MTVSVTEAENKVTQLLALVEKGEHVTIERDGQAIAEIVKPAAKKAPKFGTLKGTINMSPNNSAKRPAP